MNDRASEKVDSQWPSIVIAAIVCVICLFASGCRSLNHWSQNGWRVGPNYGGVDAAVAGQFTDSPRIDSTVVDAEWWHVFEDPNLDALIQHILDQNLSLKVAASRISEARAQRNIAAANLFPQSQEATGRYSHAQTSRNNGTAFPGIPLTTDDWSVGFDAGWEIDLWGRIRRSIDSADASLNASIDDYNFALVTLIGDAALLYINIRAFDERLELAKENIKNLDGSRRIAKARFDFGKTSKLDVVQAEANLAATQALVPQLELAQRQALNALAVLAALPPSEVEHFFNGPGKIPTIPANAIVGIPAELLQRRPDIRAAENRLAAQFEQIGIAEAEFYPTFSISGSLGYQAAKLSDLFESTSFNGAIAPGFQWKILNYGRLLNNVRVQEARVEQLCFDFQNRVLLAQQEVEDGIVEFIKNNERLEFDIANVAANEESRELSEALYTEGKEDFNRVFVVQSSLVQAQDQLVATRASIAAGLIRTYKALGGGW